jgi:hypothetical protein
MRSVAANFYQRDLELMAQGASERVSRGFPGVGVTRGGLPAGRPNR